eukprot:3141077-Ditylum_brightwellii.AAC.1
MFAVDCWDLIQAWKHGKYSIKMYVCVSKWTVRFGDGLMDMQQTNAFFTYRGVHMSNSKVRRCGYASFLTEALEQGLDWALSLSKYNSSEAFKDIVDLSVHNPLPAEALHLQYKTKGFMRNLNRNH